METSKSSTEAQGTQGTHRENQSATVDRSSYPARRDIFETTMRRQNAIEHSPKVFETRRRRDRFPSSISEFIALGRTRNRCPGLDDVEGPQIRADQSTAVACRDHQHFGRYSTRSLGALPEDPRFWCRLHRCILLLVCEA